MRAVLYRESTNWNIGCNVCDTITLTDDGAKDGNTKAVWSTVFKKFNGEVIKPVEDAKAERKMPPLETAIKMCTNIGFEVVEYEA